MFVAVRADFTITVQFQSFSTNSSVERLATGSCCADCGSTTSVCCPSACNSTVLVCLREADHPIADNSCPLGEIAAPADPNTEKLSGTFQGPWEVKYPSFACM